jgi:hypothetical protein
MSEMLATLRALEVELHHPGVRCAEQRLRELLHPAFHEVGRSGRAYDLETVVRFLASQPAPPDVWSGNFAVAALGPDVALLTYESAHRRADGVLTQRTHRSSVWLRAEGRWQLRYHQGTPAPGEVAPAPSPSPSGRGLG